MWGIELRGAFGAQGHPRVVTRGVEPWRGALAWCWTLLARTQTPVPPPPPTPHAIQRHKCPSGAAGEGARGGCRDLPEGRRLEQTWMDWPPRGAPAAGGAGGAVAVE